MMKRTVLILCAVLFAAMFLIPCQGMAEGSAEEYYTPGRIAVPKTGLPFSIKTEQEHGNIEYEAILNGTAMEQLTAEYETDDMECEVVYDILGNVTSAEYEWDDSEIFFDGRSWTDEDGNAVEAPDIDFMRGYYNDFQLEPLQIYKNNTLGLVGLCLREMDRNLTDKWYHVVPVDLTKEGTTQYDLASGNLFYMGTCDVTVADGKVTVDYAVPEGVTVHPEKQCLAWFTELSGITTEFLNNPESTFRFGEAVDIQEDLQGKEVALLFICNRISFMLPLAGSYYFPKDFHYLNPELKVYRQELMTLLERMN